MSSGPSLKKLRQATLGSTFERQLAVPGTAKIAKCQSTYLYYDWTGTDPDRADDGSTLVDHHSVLATHSHMLCFCSLTNGTEIT